MAKKDDQEKRPSLQDLLAITQKPSFPPVEASVDDVIAPSAPAILDKNLPIDSPLNTVSSEVLQKYTMEQLEAELTAASFQHSYPICGHMSIDRRRHNQLVVCVNPAGDKTEHLGRGRCCTHDTNLTITPRSPYVEYLHGFDSLQMIFERFQTRDKAIKDLTDEMGIARMALAHHCTRLEKDKHGRNSEILDKMMLCLEVIRKIAKTMADIQQAESQGITVESVDAFVWQIQRILDQEIVDTKTKIRIFDRIATECGFLRSE